MSTDGYIACAVDLPHRVDPNDTTPAAIHMSVQSPTRGMTARVFRTRPKESPGVIRQLDVMRT